MMAQQQTKVSPIVFISYAHENDSLRVAVKTLADWLGQHGCKPLTDHAFGYRPPPEGWQAWMLGCIHQADIVLVVCTPKLRQRYEKTGDLDSGRGATYEGAIVTQHIYDDIMRNDKFYPILPDEGSESDIPMALKSWWNGHRFPSGSEAIRRMIFDEPVKQETPSSAAGNNSENSDSSSRLDSHHQKLANKLLADAAAKPFYEALKLKFPEEFTGTPTPQSTAAMVQYFADCPNNQVLSLFIVVRCALDWIPHDSTNRQQNEQAAVALYCLAACRLVDQATLQAHSMAGGYLLRVPTNEHVICAIIATALFGGELRLLPTEKQDLPRPEYVFEVMVPAAGDQIVESFQRAVYTILLQNDHKTTLSALDSGALNPDQIAYIAARLHTLKNKQKGSVALIVRGLDDSQPCQSFASHHLVPVMFPADEAMSVLFGMDASRLMMEIRQFWSELKVLPRTSQPTPSPSDSQEPPGANPMSDKPPSNRDNITVIVNTGDHSALQSGTGNIAHINHRDGSGLSALTPLLAELLLEIDKVSSPKNREKLTAHVQDAQAEAAKPDKPDPDVIKNALVKVKSGAEMLEDGGKIIGLCNQAYNVLASIFALPPSPLP